MNSSNNQPFSRDQLACLAALKGALDECREAGIPLVSVPVDSVRLPTEEQDQALSRLALSITAAGLVMLGVCITKTHVLVVNLDATVAADHCKLEYV